MVLPMVLKYYRQRGIMESDDEGNSVLAFISYMSFVLYRVIQRVKLSDVLILRLLLTHVILLCSGTG